MANTNNLSIALVAQNQSQKEVTINSAISALDALLNCGAADRALDTPPGSPDEGDVYIIGSSPTDEWTGQGNNIAYYNNGWRFIAPNEGMSLWVNDEDARYVWDGAAWTNNTISAIDDLSDVTLTSAANHDFMIYNGSSWVNQVPATARSSLGLGTLATQSGTFSGTSSGTNTGDQTSVSGNAGTATALQTARAIYGNNFDGSAALTQIIASTYGGTGNGFTKFSGAASSEKTYGLPNASCNILTDNSVVTVAQGGSGAATLTGILKGNGTSAFSVATAGTDYAAGTSALATGILKSTTSTGALTIAVAGDFPTLNQNTTGSAATLTTTRAIYGNNFDGSAALTQVIASTYGGTGNGFTKFSGPATSEKTMTLPNANATLKYAGKETIWVPAAAIRPSATGGCASIATIATSANQPDIQSLDFDTTTQEYAQFAVAFPKSWNESTVTAQFFWSHASTSTNFGVVWNLQGVAMSDDDAIAAAYGTAQQVVDTGGTTNDQYVTAETSAITIAGTPAEGDLINFRVSRVTGDGSDNMAIDARLMGIKLYFTTDAGSDE